MLPRTRSAAASKATADTQSHDDRSHASPPQHQDEWTPQQTTTNKNSRNTRLHRDRNRTIGLHDHNDVSVSASASAAAAAAAAADDDDGDPTDSDADVQDDLIDHIRAANKAANRNGQGKKRKKDPSASASNVKASVTQAPRKRQIATSNAKADGRRSSAPAHSNDAVDSQEDSDSDSDAERLQALVEAEAAWANVRSRQAAQGSAVTPATPATPAAPQPPSMGNATPRSLTSWLGVGPSPSSSASELSSLPWPTTCPSAQIVDRSSLFIGYVYPLLTTSPAYISTLLSHLTRLVHPTVPVSQLPPHFANAPPNKRGSSHDMYAYRVLTLKRGRNGLTGPDDFSLHEDKEDDGEKWGGDRVLKVAKEQGASDVLVVVSRWYGGEMLGPVRFEHIENAARRALEKHVEDQMMEHTRVELVSLDAKIETLRGKIVVIEGGEKPMRTEHGQGEDKYPNLDAVKADRLLLARKRTIQVLETKLQHLRRVQDEGMTEGGEDVEMSRPLSINDDDGATDEQQDIEALLEEAGSSVPTRPTIVDDTTTIDAASPTPPLLKGNNDDTLTSNSPPIKSDTTLSPSIVPYIKPDPSVKDESYDLELESDKSITDAERPLSSSSPEVDKVKNEENDGITAYGEERQDEEEDDEEAGEDLEGWDQL